MAAVVARVERMAGPRGTYPKRVLPYLVKALDAAGLLLTEERRKRLRDHLSVLRPVLLEARLPKTCEMHDALLRELAGDGGAPASEPVCSGCGAWAKDCFCTPTPAPRRMAANPGALIQPRHMTEHEESTWCQLAVPPCQPVAAAAHDPRDFDPGAGAPMGVLLTDAAPAHEHGDWLAVAWATDDATQLSEAYRQMSGIVTRVTRLMCGRGDCTVTREVSHGA